MDTQLLTHENWGIRCHCFQFTTPSALLVIIIKTKLRAITHDQKWMWFTESENDDELCRTKLIWKMQDHKSHYLWTQTYSAHNFIVRLTVLAFPSGWFYNMIVLSNMIRSYSLINSRITWYLCLYPIWLTLMGLCKH